MPQRPKVPLLFLQCKNTESPKVKIQCNLLKTSESNHKNKTRLHLSLIPPSPCKATSLPLYIFNFTVSFPQQAKKKKKAPQTGYKKIVNFFANHRFFQARLQ
ncbi:hypothetical protein KFK09_009031 [Dendrobium nobile]|uniref:WIF domain-containing protein n=1 Tax=Dendrobium nobile TaxID=94219 RepID=A0A8T3BPM7_DENNO|nr:hypothetical protein KFK09_009031 [Dendrobium nobile]